MLIHKSAEELQALANALQALPIEGVDLTQILYREYTRQQTLHALLGTAPYRAPSSTVAAYSTDIPTTLIDNYWGLRLGLING